MTGKLSIGELIKGTGVYAGSNALASMISFILVFIFARYLSTSEYGLIAMANAFQGVLLIIIMLDLPSAVGRELFVEDKSGSHFPHYFGSSVSLVIIWGCLIMVFISLVPSCVISAVLAVDRWVLVAAGLTAFGGSVFLFQMAIWQMSNKPVPYGAVTILQVLISGLIGLVAVVGFGLGAAGRIWSLAITNVMIALIILPKMRAGFKLKWEIDLKHLREALGFSLPLLPHDLSGWTMRLADRLLLSNMATLAVTGTYSVGAALCRPISMVADGFGRAWVPFVYAALNEGTDRAKHEIVAVGKITTLTVASGGMTIALFAPDIVNIVLPRSYIDSAIVIPVLCMALVGNAMYRIFIVPMYYEKKTSLVFWSTLCGAVANVSLNILLIPPLAGLGAAWSAFLAIIVQIVVALTICQKILFLPWGLRFFTPLTLSGLISLFFPIYVSSSFFFRSLAVLSFFFLMFTPLHLSKKEYQMVLTLVLRLRQKVSEDGFLRIKELSGDQH